MNLIKNDQVEAMLTPALKRYPRAPGSQTPPTFAIYQRDWGEWAPGQFSLVILLRHEEFECSYIDGEAGYYPYAMSHKHQRARGLIEPLFGEIVKLTGARDITAHYSSDRLWRNRPMGSCWDDILRMMPTRSDDDYDDYDDDDDRRAGWPSTTGNPSGGGRDNNPPSK